MVGKQLAGLLPFPRKHLFENEVPVSRPDGKLHGFVSQARHVRGHLLQGPVAEEGRENADLHSFFLLVYATTMTNRRLP